jgi:hypothetical protein
MAEVAYGDLTQNENTFIEEKLESTPPVSKQDEPISIPSEPIPSMPDNLHESPSNSLNQIQVTLASSEKVGEGMLSSHVVYTMNVKVTRV